MNLRSEFARAVVRKIGYMLAALAVAGVLSMFASFKANAQTDPYAGCMDATIRGTMNGPVCPDKETAYTMAKAASEATVASGVYGAQVVVHGWTEAGTGVQAYVLYTIQTTGAYVQGFRKWGQECLGGATWNPTTKKCSVPCDQRPALSGSNTWVMDSPTNGSAGVCKDGCGYSLSSNAIIPCQKVDGITYCSVSGATPNSEIHCGTLQDNFGTPPNDSDHDGSSDTNDGSPHNPGSQTGDGNPPSEPQGEDGPKEDGSKACGGTGQPACEADGKGEGSGNGNTAGGGGDCNTPTTASGDAILASILFQTWKTRCAAEKLGGAVGTSEGDGDKGVVQDMGCTPQGSVAGFACTGDVINCKQAEIAKVAFCRDQAKDSDNNGQPDWMQGDEPDIPGDGDEDYDESEFDIPFGTGALDDSDIFGGGSCPNFTITVMNVTASSADIPEWCTIVAIMRAAILIMAAFFAIRILMGAV